MYRSHLRPVYTGAFFDTRTYGPYLRVVRIGIEGLKRDVTTTRHDDQSDTQLRSLVAVRRRQKACHRQFALAIISIIIIIIIIIITIAATAAATAAQVVQATTVTALTP